jgi:hypothetical protein
MDQNQTLAQEPSQVEGPFEPIQVPFADVLENNDDIIETAPRHFYQVYVHMLRFSIKHFF